MISGAFANICMVASSSALLAPLLVAPAGEGRWQGVKQ